MPTKVTDKMIIEMNEKYLLCKNKSQVAREMGVSASTVSKYIIADYTKQSDRQIATFDESMVKDPSNLFLTTDNFGTLCAYTEEEKEEMMQLWKEMQI